MKQMDKGSIQEMDEEKGEEMEGKDKEMVENERTNRNKQE